MSQTGGGNDSNNHNNDNREENNISKNMSIAIHPPREFDINA
jgi:hypothetical protein